MNGTRYNKGKLRWRNVPLWLFKPVIEVGQFGETKYETYNYLKGLPINDTLDSLKRHLCKFEDPNESDYDEESKLHHLAHVAWNALICLYVYRVKPELDDRYKSKQRKIEPPPLTKEELNMLTEDELD